VIPLSDSHPAGRFPFWTILIILANVFIFYLQLTSPDLDAFILKYALVPSFVDINNFSTFWPFVTSQFLHGGFLHIISNMLFLWIFGDNVEGRMGFLLFPIIYLASGVIGGLAQYI
jgi:membrane associated rhomboid family serine protease